MVGLTIYRKLVGAFLGCKDANLTRFFQNSLRVHTFPHHVLRENKQATGAGADRVSQGMRCAFGKNVGTAARVKRGQRVISIQVQPEHYLVARDALRKASMKFPTPCTIRLIKGHEHLKGLI